MSSLHAQFLDLVDTIELKLPVIEWRGGDVPLWPLVRMELYLDMHLARFGGMRSDPRPFALRGLARAARPVRNLWKSRRDLPHFLARPHPAHAIVLGDGVSLDRVSGAWRDRFAEPLMESLAQRGHDTFLMQSGDLSRLPWLRRTYAANTVASHGAALAGRRMVQVFTPAHAEVVKYVAARGVAAPSLAMPRLEQLATLTAATATAFERVLSKVRPTLAFVVTYYSGLAPAFLLACRRQGILSVDLQHCPQAGGHKAYHFQRVPEKGYGVLPAVFWNWSESDAARIRPWTEMLHKPWHRAVVGGHMQLEAFLDDTNPQTQHLDAQFRAVAGAEAREREILVALQPIGGQRPLWQALAVIIEQSPRSWRWWVRRHPAANPQQDEEYAALLTLGAEKVLIAPAGSLPLPTLLRHMTHVVSFASGAAAEAAVFGVPALFLSDEAGGTFSDLLARGSARIVSLDALTNAIAATPVRKAHERGSAPALQGTLQHLEQLAAHYPP